MVTKIENINAVLQKYDAVLDIALCSEISFVWLLYILKENM